MKKLIKQLSVIGLILLFSGSINAGESGITDPLHDYLMKHDPEYNLDRQLPLQLSEEAIWYLADYASQLLDKYPPQEYQIVSLGAQNIVLNAILYAVGADELTSNYIRVLPVSNLFNFSYESDKDVKSKTYRALFINKKQLNGRQPVFVRILQTGLTVSILTEDINSHLFADNLDPIFDYFTSRELFSDYNFCAHCKVNVTYNPNYKEYAAFTSRLKRLFPLNRYNPITLVPGKVPQITEETWKVNSQFNDLVDQVQIILKRMHHPIIPDEEFIPQDQELISWYFNSLYSCLLSNCQERLLYR
ncbi:MAG: hypothetical protein ACR2PT_10435 [Endozoicomonas sp.]